MYSKSDKGSKKRTIKKRQTKKSSKHCSRCRQIRKNKKHSTNNKKHSTNNKKHSTNNKKRSTISLKQTRQRLTKKRRTKHKKTQRGGFTGDDVECKGDYIHKYYENEDRTLCHLLNPYLKEYVQIKKGWTILYKLAEGGTADVFVCEKNNVKAVIIFYGNVESSASNHYDLSQKLFMAKKFPHIFPIIYDYFNVDIPYSKDQKYIENSGPNAGDFGKRTIQIIEKVDMTLEEYLHTLDQWEKDKFDDDVEKIIKEYIEELNKEGIEYADIKDDNIGIIIKENGIYIKLLDMEGIRFMKMNNQ
jgi:hypothetical protein